MFIFGSDGSGMPTTWPGAFATVVVAICITVVFIMVVKHNKDDND